MTTEGRLPLASAADALPITIRNLNFDGNLANQGSYTSYELQQSPLLLIKGNKVGVGRQPVVLENLTFTGSVSDGVHLVENVNASLKNIRATDCFRGGITITGGHSIIDVDGYVGDGDVCGAHVDVEVDTSGFGGGKGIDLSMRNIKVQSGIKPFSPFQLTLSRNSGSFVNIDSLISESGFVCYGQGSTTVITNSEIHTNNNGFSDEIFLPGDITFNNTHFVANSLKATASSVDALYVETGVNNEYYSYSPTTVTFNNCEWDVGVINPQDTVRSAIYLDRTGYSADRVVIINGGRIGQGFQNGIFMVQGGALIVKGNPLIECTNFLTLSGTSSFGLSFGADIYEVNLAPTVTSYIRADWSNDAGNFITHHDTVINGAHNVLSANQGLSQITMRGRRIIMVSSPPTASTHALKGDLARLITPIEGQTSEWEAVNSGMTGVTWVARS